MPEKMCNLYVEGIKHMKIVVFAHYDQDGIIDDYVLYYLKALAESCDKIIFVSDGHLSAGELLKINSIAAHVIAGQHGEYDFGSYKRGFAFARQEGLLDDAQWLILANDSCYGPLTSLDKVFGVMESSGKQAWGITSNYFGFNRANLPHLQSYFLALSRDVFCSEGFADFIGSVRKQGDKKNIVKFYEIGLSEWLQKNEFSFGSYVPLDSSTTDPFQFRWKPMFAQYRVPFIKVSMVGTSAVSQWQRIVERNTDYPFGLIVLHRSRTGIFAFKSRNGQPLPLNRKIKLVRRYIIRWQRKNRRVCFFGVWYTY